MTIKELLTITNKKFEDYYNIINNDTYLLIDKALTSLEGLPEDTNRNLNLSTNQLKTLEGLPEDFNAELIMSENKLKNLKGLPKNFNSEIWLYNNPIESLDGLNDVLDPEKIIGLDKDFIISEYKRLGKHHLLI